MIADKEGVLRTTHNLNSSSPAEVGKLNVIASKDIFIKRLLVISTCCQTREMLVSTLRDEGCAVDFAEDENTGLYRAKYWQYDVIILDMTLDTNDGWMILSELKQVAEARVLSLIESEDLKHRAFSRLNSEIDDCLLKPLVREQVISHVSTMVRNAKNSEAPGVFLHAGSVELNLPRREVRLKGVLVEMTAKEYELTELLIRNQEKAISRKYIREQIFQDAGSDELLSNILDVYIYKLRSKLGKAFIKTQRGFGYIIDTAT